MGHQAPSASSGPLTCLLAGCSLVQPALPDLGCSAPGAKSIDSPLPAPGFNTPPPLSSLFLAGGSLPVTLHPTAGLWAESLDPSSWSVCVCPAERRPGRHGSPSEQASVRLAGPSFGGGPSTLNRSRGFCLPLIEKRGPTAPQHHNWVCHYHAQPLARPPTCPPGLPFEARRLLLRHFHGWEGKVCSPFSLWGIWGGTEGTLRGRGTCLGVPGPSHGGWMSWGSIDAQQAQPEAGSIGSASVPPRLCLHFSVTALLVEGAAILLLGLHTWSARCSTLDLAKDWDRRKMRCHSVKGYRCS